IVVVYTRVRTRRARTGGRRGEPSGRVPSCCGRRNCAGRVRTSMMPGPRVQQILQNESPSRSAVAGELVRAHEITHVLDALAARRVFPILMKGAALAYSLYPSPAMRPRVDTDLLIPREDIAAARDVLLRRGYVEPAMTDGELVLGQ